MFSDEFELMCGAAESKTGFLRKNPGGYVAASVMAGAFIGFGILLAFTAGACLDGASCTKIVMGLSFGVALSLVVMAGAELFTGNNMVMLAGVIERRIKVSRMICLWAICFAGNWAGAVLLSLIYSCTGLADGAVGEFMVQSAVMKASLDPVQLICRAVLCNMLVCLAVWCGFRCKSEAGKLIMIFWCLFAFVTTGFEHSIANMTLLTTSLLVQTGGELTLAGYFYNIFVAALGNIIGGTLCVALPYYVISRKSGNKECE
ncbi:MAG: formate/nitrite transporter family protein [Clostridiales bacterium]|nr:formate/nitrite transporter family protein [Clostridiales bacterium]MDD7035474.1 formate/nitrite transporter family protein [Bacillota bacterium]MDY2919943.1 formate/nitrite transporter family protein [Lentihominibacter sp.]